MHFITNFPNVPDGCVALVKGTLVTEKNRLVLTNAVKIAVMPITREVEAITVDKIVVKN